MTLLDTQALEAAARVLLLSMGFDPDEALPIGGVRWRYHASSVETAITAYLSAREAQGFVEAPAVATPTMIRAAIDRPHREGAFMYELIWEAMLSASQAAKTGEG